MRWTVGVVVASSLGVWSPCEVEACAPAPPDGHIVDIVGEDAVIIWDSKERVEHFIRRASFESDAASFGFLVPTPTVPDLAEVPDEIFDALTNAIRPKTVERTGYRFMPISIVMTPFMFLTRSADTGMVMRGGVEVLKSQRVAGYDAVVLAADDPAALAAWLDEHGFANGPELKAWLAVYVKKQWKLSAFKIAKERREANDTATSAVRMSFPTDEPFYPYREPASQRSTDRAQPNRVLRVFVITDGPTKGMLTGAPWKSRLLYRASASEIGSVLSKDLKPLVPDTPWLHAWIDRSSPRPGVDDVFFAPDVSASEVVPPPNVLDRRQTIVLPIDLVWIGGLVWWWRVRRRRRDRT